ncbi:MAG: DUF3500 domain-containing protein, partial [Bryobacteraceae bacterium]
MKTYILVVTLGIVASGLAQAPNRIEQFKARSEQAEKTGLAEPYKGVTTNGEVQPGLFPIRSSGVSTEPMRKTTDAFLASLAPEQRAKTKFPVDDPEWRKWMNQHFYIRQGIAFKDMDENQRELAVSM